MKASKSDLDSHYYYKKWEKAAKNLYEHLNPGTSWYEFPADKRDEWIRVLRRM